MQTIPVQQAVGTVLAHDVTRIVPGREKGPAFRKGHIIREQDIDALLDMGKAHVFVLELGSGRLHEDTAALRLATAAAGPGLKLSLPSEGRINLTAERSGLLKVDDQALARLNSIEEIVFATLHGNHRVQAGQPVAGTRVVPLVIAESKIEAAEALCRQNAPLIQVKPFQALKVGMVTTGNEVYHGRVRDQFGPVVNRKVEELGSRVFQQIFVADDIQKEVAAIRTLIDAGAQMVVLTGGMSVDPDDRSADAIRASGARVVTYGSPTFPGAMFMLAYLDGVPLLGLPGCIMYHKTSIFDLIVPRLLAGETVSRADIVRLGHGGFCAACVNCRYPLCGFGKA